MILTKIVYITGVEGPGSGMWDWWTIKDNADKAHNENIAEFKDIKSEVVYRGELNVPEQFVGDEITAYVESYLLEHGFEQAPLNNKIIKN